MALRGDFAEIMAELRGLRADQATVLRRLEGLEVCLTSIAPHWSAPGGGIGDQFDRPGLGGVMLRNQQDSCRIHGVADQPGYPSQANVYVEPIPPTESSGGDGVTGEDATVWGQAPQIANADSLVLEEASPGLPVDHDAMSEDESIYSIGSSESTEAVEKAPSLDGSDVPDNSMGEEEAEYMQQQAEQFTSDPGEDKFALAEELLGVPGEDALDLLAEEPADAPGEDALAPAEELAGASGNDASAMQVQQQLSPSVWSTASRPCGTALQAIPTDPRHFRGLVCPTSDVSVSIVAEKVICEVCREYQAVQPARLQQELEAMRRGSSDIVLLEGDNVLMDNRQINIAKMLGRSFVYVETHQEHHLARGARITCTDRMDGPKAALLPVEYVISEHAFIVKVPEEEGEFDVEYAPMEHTNLAQVHAMSPAYDALLSEAQERKKLGISQPLLVILLGHETKEVARNLAELGIPSLEWQRPNEAVGAGAFVEACFADLPAPEGPWSFLVTWRDHYLRKRFDALKEQFCFKDPPEWHSPKA